MTFFAVKDVASTLFYFSPSILLNKAMKFLVFHTSLIKQCKDRKYFYCFQIYYVLSVGFCQIIDKAKWSGPDGVAPLGYGMSGRCLFFNGDLQGPAGGAEDVYAGGEGVDVAAGRRLSEEETVEGVDVCGSALCEDCFDVGLDACDVAGC